MSTIALPGEMFLRPVEGHDDMFAFRYDFELEGKALADGERGKIVTELDDGDLLIEGWAAVWDGDDRQGENFAPGSFQAGITRFLNGQAALCYHHQHDKCLGKVLDLREEGKGLWMKARVDGSIKEDPRLKSIYQQIKRGTYNGLSTYGYFTRGARDLANKIVKTDLTEISITPVPVHPGTSLAVVAGKALSDPEPQGESSALDAVLAAIKSATERIGAKALPDAHDPEAARHVSDLLGHLQRTRTTASFSKEYADHKGVKAAADALETDLAKHEAALHKLAAKVGPLPPHNNY